MAKNELDVHILSRPCLHLGIMFQSQPWVFTSEYCYFFNHKILQRSRPLPRLWQIHQRCPDCFERGSWHSFPGRHVEIQPQLHTGGLHDGGPQTPKGKSIGVRRHNILFVFLCNPTRCDHYQLFFYQLPGLSWNPKVSWILFSTQRILGLHDNVMEIQV